MQSMHGHADLSTHLELPGSAGDLSARSLTTRLARLREVARAELWFAVRYDGGGRPVDWCTSVPALEEVLLAVQDRGRLQPLGFPDSDASLVRPALTWTRRFVSPLEGGAAQDAEKSPFAAEVRRRLGVRDQLALLVYQGRRHVAHIGVLRRRERRFVRADWRRLQPVVRDLAHEARRLARATHATSARGTVLLNADGSIRSATREAQTYLETSSGQAALARLQTRSRGTPDGRMAFAGADLEWRQLLGEEGPATMVVVRPPTDLVLAADACLSPAQREIAARAVAGQSAKAIASALECSPDTVRSHLRQIYRRLEVTNRAELAKQLTEPEPRP